MTYGEIKQSKAQIYRNLYRKFVTVQYSYESFTDVYSVKQR